MRIVAYRAARRLSNPGEACGAEAGERVLFRECAGREETIITEKKRPPAGLLRKAAINDAEPIRDLIRKYAERKLLLPRALSELYEQLRDFFVYEVNGRVVGCGALHITWADLAEVKSLAVDEGFQRQGIGSRIVQACLDEARAMGIARVFTLTYRAEFFERLGFRRVPKESLPHKIWSECIKCPEFPNCKEIPLIIDLDEGKGPSPTMESDNEREHL